MQQLFPVLILCSVALFHTPAFAQTVPSNTVIVIRLDQGVSSQNAKRNQRVKARVAEDVVVNGDVLIPKGAPAAVFVSRVQAGDNLSKSALLTLRLDAVTVGGRAYPVSADYAGEKSVHVNTPKNQGVTGSETLVKGQATNQRTAASGGAATGNTNADLISDQGAAEVSYSEDTVLSFRLVAPLRVK